MFFTGLSVHRPRTMSSFANSIRFRLLHISVFILFTLVLAAFILPYIMTVLPNSLNSTAKSSGGYSASQLVRIAAYTFAQSIGSTVIAIAAGLPAAWLTSRRIFPGRKILASFACIPVCIPPLIIALGYISAFGVSGHVSTFLKTLCNTKDSPITFLYTFAGLILTQGFYNFPVIMSSVGTAISQLDSRQADSAKLLGAGKWRIFRTVTFYQLLSPLITGAATVFLYCFFSFMLVLLFGTRGGTTLEVTIYHAGRSTLDFRAVSVLAIIETSCALAALFVISLMENKAKREKEFSFHARTASPVKLNKKEIFPVFFYLSIISVCFVLPLISIFTNSTTVHKAGKTFFTLSSWVKLFSSKSFALALLHTVETAVPVAVICTICGTLYASFSRLSPAAQNALFRTIPMLPMSVSSVVTGIGMTILVKKGSPLILVLAQSALYWPFAFRLVYQSMCKIPQYTIDAAFMLSSCKTEGIVRVLIPYCKKNILSALGFCFALSAGDASLPLVLAVAKFDTLAIYTYRLVGAYKYPQACACGIILGLLCITIYALTCSEKKEHKK